MEPFASVDELQSRWSRTLTQEERARAAVLLGDASRRLRKWFLTNMSVDLDAAIADETYDAEDAEVAVIEMVKRAMIGEGSDGVEQITETAGPFTKSVRYSTKNLYVTAKDIANWFDLNLDRAKTVWVS